MSKDKIIDTIDKLRRMTSENGATENEVMIALRKVADLMAEHGIDEVDIVNANVKKDFREGGFAFRQKQEHPVSRFCGREIAQFCGVCCWYGDKAGWEKAGLRGYGMKEDMEMFDYLSKLIHDAMDRGWKEYIKENKKDVQRVNRHAEYWGFMRGFADRVVDKLREIMLERIKTADGRSKTSRDLIIKREKYCEELAVKEFNLELVTSKTKSIKVDTDALNAGEAAGDRVNLNRPINEKRQDMQKQISA